MIPPPSAPTPHAARFFWIDVLVLVQAIAVQLFLATANLRIPFSRSFFLFSRMFLAFFLVGLAVHFGYHAVRRRLRPFLARIWSWDWILISLRLLVIGALTVHSYAWLKVTIPVTNPRSFDVLFWELDRLLLFGMSPNVFFLELFSWKPLLATVDWYYSRVFIFTVRLSIPLFLAAPSNSLRLGFVLGNLIVWGGGAWIYVALPAMGPVYRFAELWEPVHTTMTHTWKLQFTLLRNYNLALHLADGVVDPRLNVLFGIAAFPSLHVAYQTFIACWLRAFSRWLGLAGLILVVAMFLGSIVTGWHYLVDSIAGLGLGLLAFVMARRVWRRGETSAT